MWACSFVTSWFNPDYNEEIESAKTLGWIAAKFISMIARTISE